MKAHFFKDGRRWRFSGYNACGDPYDGKGGTRPGPETATRPFDAVVDIGREFILTSDGRLYLTGLGKGQFSTFSPEAVLLAAKLGHFGFKLIDGGKEYANG